MKLQFVLAPEDHVAFNIYHVQHSPAFRRICRKQILFSWLAVLVLSGMISWGLESWTNFLVGVILSPLVPVIGSWQMRRQVRANTEKMIAEGKNSGIYGPQELELADRRLVLRSEGRMSSIDVRYLEKVVRTADHLFIYVSGLSAHVVPCAFVTDDELDEFLDSLNETCPDFTETPNSSTAISEFVRGKVRTTERNVPS